MKRSFITAPPETSRLRACPRLRRHMGADGAHRQGPARRGIRVVGEGVPAGRLSHRDALGDVTIWIGGSTAAQHLRPSRAINSREKIPARASGRIVDDRVAADTGLSIGAGIALRPRDALRPRIALRALWARRAGRPCLVPRDCRLTRAAAAAAAHVDHAELSVVRLVAGVDHALVVRDGRVGDARRERERAYGGQGDEQFPLHRFLLMAHSWQSPTGVQIRITNVSTPAIIRMTLKVGLRRLGPVGEVRGRERRGLNADLFHPRDVAAVGAAGLAVRSSRRAGGHQGQVRRLVEGVALEQPQRIAADGLVVAAGGRQFDQCTHDGEVDGPRLLARPDRPVLVQILLQEVAPYFASATFNWETAFWPEPFRSDASARSASPRNASRSSTSLPVSSATVSRVAVT